MYSVALFCVLVAGIQVFQHSEPNPEVAVGHIYHAPSCSPRLGQLRSGAPHLAQIATMAAWLAVPQEISRRLVIMAGARLGQNALMAISSSPQGTAHSRSCVQS